MVSSKSVEEQLKKIGFKRGWNRPETEELAAILLADEEIFECVNGWYEGGYCLLAATNFRVLLIDRKPFKFLTIEDVRFDTISQIDYSHRMFNASICITTAGLKSLVFKSYNQPRLRKLISHVQHRMAEIKKIEEVAKSQTQSNLKAMDQQLRAYLLSQYDQHQFLKRQHEPSLPPLNNVELVPTALSSADDKVIDPEPMKTATGVSPLELYEDGIKEIFGQYQSEAAKPIKTIVTIDDPSQINIDDQLDINPLKIAYSKLPMILRIKKMQASNNNA